jgi:hypothetical protein
LLCYFESERQKTPETLNPIQSIPSKLLSTQIIRSTAFSNKACFCRRRRSKSLQLDGVLEGKETRAVGKEIVRSSRLGVTSLVEELKVARVDGHGLIGVGTDKITVRNVIGPGGTAVGLAGEGVALRSGLRSPGTTERGGGEGAEVAAVGTLCLDDHEILVLALQSVDLDSLEEVVGGIAHDDGGSTSEAAREVANGHAGTVNLAIVAGKEQVHVLAVTNHGLIDGTGARGSNGASEHGLSGRPAVSVAGVLRSAVREGGRTPLVSEDPNVLGSKVEEGRGNSRRAHGVLAGAAHLRPIAEETKVHGTIVAARVVVGSVDNVLAVVEGGGKILDGGPAALRGGKSRGRRPLKLGREVASCGSDLGNRCEKHGSRHQASLSDGEFHVERMWWRKIVLVKECLDEGESW